MQKFNCVTRELPAPYEDTFRFIADPANLPKWTVAFRQADETSALIQRGSDEPFRIGLTTVASVETGLIDWYMDMPDGRTTRTLTRVIDLLNGKCLYTFIFFANPAPEDQAEATLANQTAAIEKEFDNLVRLLGA
jgi:uncharacterized protein YndB with AHSA1/START domain